MRRLEGRTAIVTGSGSAGFGRAIAPRVAEEGANVVVADLRRMGGVDDIAAAVAYLASDDASYVTGQEIVVDGGFLCAPVEQP